MSHRPLPLVLALLLGCGDDADHRARLGNGDGTQTVAATTAPAQPASSAQPSAQPTASSGGLPGGEGAPSFDAPIPDHHGLMPGHALGTTFAEGWRVTRIDSRPGSLSLMLSDPHGGPIRVELFRLDPSDAPPAASSDVVAAYVMDGGDFATEPTSTDCGLIGALDALLGMQKDAAKRRDLAKNMLTRRDRANRYPWVDHPEILTAPRPPLPNELPPTPQVGPQPGQQSGPPVASSPVPTPPVPTGGAGSNAAPSGQGGRPEGGQGPQGFGSFQGPGAPNGPSGPGGPGARTGGGAGEGAAVQGPGAPSVGGQGQGGQGQPGQGGPQGAAGVAGTPAPSAPTQQPPASSEPQPTSPPGSPG